MNDRIISWYGEHADQIASRYGPSDATPRNTLLQKWIPSGANVLEIGCGFGRDAFFLASLGCTVTATDGSDSMMQTARRRLPKEAEGKVSFQHDLFPLPDNHTLLSKKFSAITVISVLIHIPDSDFFSFARQMEILLEDGGVLFCSFFLRRTEGKRRAALREPGSRRSAVFFERLGFRLLAREETKDGLGRNILWTTLLFQRRGV